VFFSIHPPSHWVMGKYNLVIRFFFCDSGDERSSISSPIISFPEKIDCRVNTRSFLQLAELRVYSCKRDQKKMKPKRVRLFNKFCLWYNEAVKFVFLLYRN
jgi:hypothetical protein